MIKAFPILQLSLANEGCVSRRQPGQAHRRRRLRSHSALQIGSPSKLGIPFFATWPPSKSPIGQKLSIPSPPSASSIRFRPKPWVFFFRCLFGVSDKQEQAREYSRITPIRPVAGTADVLFIHLNRQISGNPILCLKPPIGFQNSLSAANHLPPEQGLLARSTCKRLPILPASKAASNWARLSFNLPC